MQWAQRQHKTRRNKKIFSFGTVGVLVFAQVLAVVAMLAVSAGTASAAANATWKDATTITYEGNDYTGPESSYTTLTGDVILYIQEGSDATCPPTIYFSGEDAKDDGHNATSAKYDSEPDQDTLSSVCLPTFGVTISITPFSDGGGDGGGGGSGGGGSGGSGGSTADGTTEIDPCDAKLENPLTWIICPVIGIMHEATMKMQDWVNHLMTIDVKGIFEDTDNPDSSGHAYYTAWNTFRILGLAVIIIAGLVMVISQALGMDIFDPYTVKKVLPRLLIAVIGISLSWWLLKFFVEITNDLGIGVRSLIYLPFKSLGSGIDPSLGGSLLGSLGLAGGAVALVALGAGGVLSLLATVGLAVLIAFVVLVARQVIITFLILVAPIAIALYVLPNTQKAYKLWWDSLSKGLLMFPIITAFLATGQVFALVANNNTSGSYGLTDIVAVLAYFLPYFAIPFTFRLAGGAIATLGGLVNDRSRGTFDRLKKQRGEIRAKRYQRAVNGQLWDPNSKIQKALRGNKFAENIAAPHKGAAYALRGSNVPILSRYGRRLESGVHAATLEQSQKWMEHVNKHGANDKFYSAVGGMYDGLSGQHADGQSTQQKLVDAGFAQWVDDGRGGRRIQALRSLKTEADFNKMASILEGSSSDSEQKAAMALRANASYTGELFRDPEMNYVDTAIGASLGRAAHGFLTSRDSADNENLIMAEHHGDKDFAHAAAVQAQAIGGRSNPDNKAGYGTHYDERQGKFVTAYESDRAWAVLDTIKPGDYAQAKGNVLKPDRMGGVFEDSLKIAAGDQQAEQALRAKLQSFGMSAADIDKRVASVAAAAPAVRDTLFSMAGPYSQADPTAKEMALKMISDNGLTADFSRYTRTGEDLAGTGRTAPPTDDQGQQPGGGPGQ